MTLSLRNQINWQEAGEEAVQRLREYLMTPTVNSWGMKD